MRKEYEIKYLIGFEIKYKMYDGTYHFLTNSNVVMVKYNIRDCGWKTVWNKLLEDDSNISITEKYLYYINEYVLITKELKEKLESYYTYMKRKNILEKLDI